MSPPSVYWLVVILVQRWRWIGAVTLVCALGMLAALPFITTQYEITARLLFKPGREQFPHAVVGGNAAGPAFRRTEDVTSEAEIIAGQPLIESLVRAFGPDYFLARKPPASAWEHVKEAARSVVRWVREAVSEVMILVGLEKRLTPFEKVVSLVQQSLRAEPVKRADVVEITLRMPDQKAGVEVMNKLIELYIDAHIKAFKTPGATQFLLDRVEALTLELATLEDRRRKFSQAHAVWDLEEQRRALLAQQRDLRQAQSRTTADIGRLQAEIDQARETLASPPKETRVTRVEQINPVVQSLNSRIADQRARIEKLRLVFGADSRRIADEEAELAQLEKQLSEQKRSITQSETFAVSEGYRDTERGLTERHGRLAGLRGQQQRQASEDERLTAQLGELDARAELSRQLARDLALAEQNYHLYVRRREEARIADALDAAAISNVSVIGHPTASVKPVAPRSILLFLGALAAGLLGSFGFFLLRDALQPTVHSRAVAADVLGAPVLARLTERGRAGHAFAGAPDGSAAVKPGVLQLMHEFEHLREELPARHIAVTGARGGEGVSTAAFGIARALARRGPTLLVEGNLRQPVLAKRLGLSGPGLTEWNGTGPLPIHQLGGAAGVSVLCAGDAQALGGQDIAALLAAAARQVRNRFVHVVWDTPPLTVCPDLLVLAPHIDGALVVMEMDGSRIDELLFLRDMLARAQVPIIGSLLNRSGRYWPQPRRHLGLPR